MPIRVGIHNALTVVRVQDFEALTPNLMARTIETVEGGGIVVLLLSTLRSLKDLFSLSMDVHSRLRTESHQDVTGAMLTPSDHGVCLLMGDLLKAGGAARWGEGWVSYTGFAAEGLEFINTDTHAVSGSIWCSAPLLRHQ